MNPGPEHPFNRKYVAVGERRLIESTCALCGFRIVGSIMHNLREDEDGHAATCPDKQPTTSRDTASAS